MRLWVSLGTDWGLMDGFSWFLIALVLMFLNDLIGVSLWYMAVSRTRAAPSASWGSLIRRYDKRLAVTLGLGMEIAWLGVVCIMWNGLTQVPVLIAMLVIGGIGSPLLIGWMTYSLFDNLSRQMIHQWADDRRA